MYPDNIRHPPRTSPLQCKLEMPLFKLLVLNNGFTNVERTERSFFVCYRLAKTKKVNLLMTSFKEFLNFVKVLHKLASLLMNLQHHQRVKDLLMEGLRDFNLLAPRRYWSVQTYRENTPHIRTVKRSCSKVDRK